MGVDYSDAEVRANLTHRLIQRPLPQALTTRRPHRIVIDSGF
jgi:hypothetical protein